MRPHRSRRLVAFGLVVLIVSACSAGTQTASQDTSASDTTVAEATTTTATVTSTTAAPTTTAPPSSTTVPVRKVIEVTFDGIGCDVHVPLSRPAGDQAFIVTNHSDLAGVDLLVGSLVDGHVFQELLDMQTEVGGAPAYVDQPDWLVFESYSFNPDSVPDIGLVENQKMSVFLLTEGYDTIWLTTANPLRLWFCAPLEVTAE